MHRKTTGELVQGKFTFGTGLAMLVQALFRALLLKVYTRKAFHLVVTIPCGF